MHQLSCMEIPWSNFTIESPSKYGEGPLPESFMDTLKLFTNWNMWDFMYLDDDREWITETILNGTLDVVHDGSYQPKVTKHVCSTAV